MLTHALAQLLLQFPNMEIATHANNHTYSNLEGHLKVAEVNFNFADGTSIPHAVIGNFRKEQYRNNPNITYVRRLELSGE